MKITVRKSDSKLQCWNGGNDNNDPLLEEYNVSDVFPEGDFNRMFYNKDSNSIVIKPFSAQELYDIDLAKCLAQRKQAYLNESDGLFFDYQRGEIEKSVWESKIEEIKARYPKPVTP